MDKSPAVIRAILLDEGVYRCSDRTMYRLLHSRDEVRERLNQARRRDYTKPELLATAPNRVWSWDITKLKGPVKGELYYVYSILDLFSRFAVGWMIARSETAELAKQLFEETCARQGIDPERLHVHSDRGSPMKAKTFTQFLEKLGVNQSFSRPHVSNDNAFSESHFKTLKEQPGFPARFGSFEDAEAYCQWFFPHYNHEHRHSGIAMMTPYMVHYGLAPAVNRKRQQILHAAFSAHPERFVNGSPRTQQLPEAVWINRPAPEKAADILAKELARDGRLRADRDATTCGSAGDGTILATVR